MKIYPYFAMKCKLNLILALFLGNSRCGALSCDHACAPTPTGGICYCNPGYALDPADNRTCVGE